MIKIVVKGDAKVGKTVLLRAALIGAVVGIVGTTALLALN